MAAEWGAARSQIAAYEGKASALASTLQTQKDALAEVQSECKAVNEGAPAGRSDWV